ncbi:MAG TPA: lysylphosphatidylglycerol synthase transmembrane domain-containing protein [Rhodocyclaceae bacterium]|uniref:lysylphosphatidylglycerol synthase transmembrane domain-containing protein n=1 Tax=Zoogloea sp. TaxID=49181 RepID=UPI002C799CAC|nr:lysylphosphatidylglycerol synthase transmembrane domain-containing protein [Zoogloea sp.]HMV64392.1 lysylphosphatidylglycerol synthase transmembrane domain-containing protein [Rhodocyclaceae bacterium]HMW52328.1 lysylphosphatidylglycerol synthase transmembrane domain-containing protein [Rhodocyclaceae bacterium]HNA67610.1 lysylphosphatidylglycerol synthase transmembrane domain-containing protein [Rhodocyclaceae bacterium]HNB66033.1 lysylphosphatidylglycerol synthase transmembrane domain-cont
MTLKRLFAVALSLALIGWLAADGRWRGVGEVFARVPLSVLAVSALGFGLSYSLRALRVWDEFRRHASGRFGACLRIVLIHSAMINVLPFRGGEAAFPLLLRQTFGVPLPRALASLFWFRLQDAFAVMGVAALVWPGLPTLLKLAGAVSVFALAWWLPRWARAPHAWADHGGLTAKLAKLRDAFAESTRHARFGWLWTLTNWSVKLAAQAWLLAALIPAALDVGAAGALGAELAAILPVQGVAGFGTYEAGAAAALLPSGVALATGLQVALALHLFVIAVSVSGGALAWLVPVAAPAEASAPDADPSADVQSASSAADSTRPAP